MRVRRRHNDIFHWALQFFGDLAARTGPHVFRHIAQIGIQEGGASQAVVEHDGADVQALVFILAGRRILGIDRRRDVDAGRARAQMASFRSGAQYRATDE